MNVSKASEKKDKEDSKTDSLIYWFFVAVFIFAISAIYFVLSFYTDKFNGDLSNKPDVWGMFGDYIGGTLNPILSFLSLMALLFTIVLQNKELKLTRDELHRSATAQEATQKIMDEQSVTLERQQFESTFFSLIEQHNKILEGLHTRDNDGHYPLNSLRISVLYGDRNLSGAKSALMENNAICGHYFRVLYQLLKFITTNAPSSSIGTSFNAKEITNEPVSHSEKMYSNMLRSFLDFEITQLLAINCYCESPDDIYWKYKLLIERYELLEHMPFDVGGRQNKALFETKGFYARSSFGNSVFIKNIEQE